MKFQLKGLSRCSGAVLLLAGMAVGAQEPAATNQVQVIDLATTLKLAGARNLDVQIARERLSEARANAQSALWQFFPWVSAGISYRGHDNLIQDVAGNMIDVHKDAYSVGPTLNAQVALGEAIYERVAARQIAKAAGGAVESRRAETLLTAAQGYFDLLKADAAIGIARDAVRITDNYLQQVGNAVEAGIAFKGDQLRVQVQAERNRLTLRKAEEQLRLASAQLVQVLHLDPSLHLAPVNQELLPVSLILTNASIPSLLARAEAARPEIRESKARTHAAQASSDGARYGPLIPTIGAQAFVGGLGGGRHGAGHTFDDSEDYQVGLFWRIGPGGLFDRSRVRANDARLRIAELENEKLYDSVSRQVIEQHSRLQSLGDQLSFAKRAAAVADDSLRLSQGRKEFAVGNVLETILAEQELTRARLELSEAIADYNKAQYGLAQAVGDLE